MFNFIREKLSKVYNSFTQQISSLFYRNDRSLDETVKELEKLFIQADAGVQTTKEITQKFKAAALAISEDDRDLKKVLNTTLQEFVKDVSRKQVSE